MVSVMRFKILLVWCSSLLYLQETTGDEEKKKLNVNVPPMSLRATNNSTVCIQGEKQSPIDITKKAVLYAHTSALGTITPVGRNRRTFTFMVVDGHIVGIPNYQLVIQGTPLLGIYDLYSFHLYPYKLHSVEGLDTPSLEIQLRFIYGNPRVDTEYHHYDRAYLQAAANENRLLNVVQLVTLLGKNERYKYKRDIEYFIDCTSQIFKQDKTVCDTILDSMVVRSGGYYFYHGSLMYPSCDETAEHIILNETLKISAEHLRLIKASWPHFNTRPQQPLNQRWVTFYTASSLRNVPVASVLWVIAFGSMLESGI